MPCVAGVLLDGRVTFRTGLRAPFMQFPKHCLGFAPGEEVGSLGTRANWCSWASIVNQSLIVGAFLCNGWHFCATGGISVQRVAFLCNGWHFCATSGVCVLHSNLHRNRTAGCDSSKAT